MEIEKAFKKLIITSPFYGIFCLNLPKTITTEIPTLCVRRKGINLDLCINPDFWKTLSDEEQLAVLKHEVSHIAFQHMFMSDFFPNSKLFNVSADLEVNSYIDNLPKGALVASKFGMESGLGTKAYYEKLNSDGNDYSQSGEGQPYPDNMPEGTEAFDSHETWKDFNNCSEA